MDKLSCVNSSVHIEKTTWKKFSKDLDNLIKYMGITEEGEIVVTRGITRGTHQGSFGQLAPTGKSVAVPWVIITRIRDGRIVEDWEIYDGLGMMTQLGMELKPKEVEK